MNWLNVSKNTTVIFANAGQRHLQPRPVTHFGEPIELFGTTRYLELTIDKRVAWSTHIHEVRKNISQTMNILGCLQNRKCGLSVRNWVLIYTDSSVPEMVCVTLYFLAPYIEPNLTTIVDVQEAIKDLKASKSRVPNGITNRALKHFPQWSITILAQIINAIQLTHHFPTLWKHARLISILKPGTIQKCPQLISPLFSFTRLVNYLKNPIN